MKWELINPSDYYTVESDNFKCAAVAAFILGEGKYGLEPIEDTDASFKLPLFIFGGADDWAKREFSESLESMFQDCMENRKSQLISALRSVNIEDSKRSSMNNIAARAQRLANKLEEGDHGKPE